MWWRCIVPRGPAGAGGSQQFDGLGCRLDAGTCRVAGQELAPLELARWANRVEVEHFGAPGGHMDHVASALGGTLRVHSDWNVERLERSGDGVWVVVDSGEPKDTRSHPRPDANRIDWPWLPSTVADGVRQWNSRLGMS